MITLLGAAVLLAAPSDLTPFDPAAWVYPGTKPYAGTSGGGGSLKARHVHYSMKQTTPDAYETVLAHYQRLVGTTERNFTSTYIDVHVDSTDRPVKLAVVERRWTYGIVTVVISRADAEDLTHIVLSYRTPIVPGPDQAVPRKPGDPPPPGPRPPEPRP